MKWMWREAKASVEVLQVMMMRTAAQRRTRRRRRRLLWKRRSGKRSKPQRRGQKRRPRKQPLQQPLPLRHRQLKSRNRPCHLPSKGCLLQQPLCKRSHRSLLFGQPRHQLRCRDVLRRKHSRRPWRSSSRRSNRRSSCSNSDWLLSRPSKRNKLPNSALHRQPRSSNKQRLRLQHRRPKTPRDLPRHRSSTRRPHLASALLVRMTLVSWPHGSSRLLRPSSSSSSCHSLCSSHSGQLPAACPTTDTRVPTPKARV
mmetsp:Transcript_17501/g.41187  ORF Transcript_17501/g.41187 Transcript_17501/m.41187 type:complete len:255 (-) Transcript_17501:536-1300(-)